MRRYGTLDAFSFPLVIRYILLFLEQRIIKQLYNTFDSIITFILTYDYYDYYETN